jgi:exonuclease III
MRFGTWNVRSLYRSGSLTAIARDLAWYKLDLIGVQEVRWDKGGTVKRPYRRSSRRLDDNKMDLQEVGWGLNGLIGSG